MSFRATARIRRGGGGGVVLLNESKTFPVVGKGERAEADARRMAREWAEELERQFAGSPELIPAHKQRKVQLAVLIDKYIAEAEGTPKPVAGSKLSVLRQLQSGPLGVLSLDAFTETRLINYAKARVSGEVTGRAALPQTVLQDFIYLRLVLEAAKRLVGVRLDLEAFDDAMKTIRSKGLVSKSQERNRRLQPGELERLLAVASNRRSEKTRNGTPMIPLDEIIRFAIASGMRAGEIFGLRWADLNERDRTILIRDRKDPQEKQGNDQEVPLLGEAWEVVSRQPRSGELVFPYNSDSARTAFARACAKAGISDLTFHDLRREGVTRLFEQGYQIQEVSLVSGHKSWKNLKRYTRLRAVDLHRAEPTPVEVSDRTDRR